MITILLFTYAKVFIHHPLYIYFFFINPLNILIILKRENVLSENFS